MRWKDTLSARLATRFEGRLRHAISSVFVLDRYNINKALKGTVNGIERKFSSQYEPLLLQS